MTKLEIIALYAKNYDLYLKENLVRVNVYRLIDGQLVYQGSRKKSEIEALRTYIIRLINSIDYENSKIEC